MAELRVLIIYYSSTGTNYQLAQWAEKAARENGADVRLCKAAELASDSAIEKNPAWKAHAVATEHVPEVVLDDLDWADVYIFSVPTRFGIVPAQMKQFLDSAGGLWQQGKLANKVVTAMASAANPHGGQEETILSLYTVMYHWGAIVVAPGYTNPAIFKAGGNPYGTSVSVGEDGKMKEDIHDAVHHQVQRACQVGEWIRKGSSGNIK